MQVRVVISIRRGVNVAYSFLYLFKYIDVTCGERALGTNRSSCETYINIYVGGTSYSLYITIFYISYMYYMSVHGRFRYIQGGYAIIASR